jgi:heme/copper-type cytochrome/quinol oxidase subunit 2
MYPDKKQLLADVSPDKVNKIASVPDITDTFDFHCDVSCGSSHEQMAGTITVTE